MSQENVRIVQRAVDAYNRRDLAALLVDVADDAVWVEDQRYPGAQTYYGPSGIERSLRKWWDAFGESVMELEELIDLGDRVVAAGQVRQRGHDSNVVLTAPFAGVYEFRGNKVVRVQVLGSRAEALEAVGLSE
jgi:uncharacterized protein